MSTGARHRNSCAQKSTPCLSRSDALMWASGKAIRSIRQTRPCPHGKSRIDVGVTLAVFKRAPDALQRREPDLEIPGLPGIPHVIVRVKWPCCNRDVTNYSVHCRSARARPQRFQGLSRGRREMGLRGRQPSVRAASAVSSTLTGTSKGRPSDIIVVGTGRPSRSSIAARSSLTLCPCPEPMLNTPAGAS